jgi:hypothetical protein
MTVKKLPKQQYTFVFAICSPYKDQSFQEMNCFTSWKNWASELALKVLTDYAGLRWVDRLLQRICLKILP